MTLDEQARALTNEIDQLFRQRNHKTEKEVQHLIATALRAQWEEAANIADRFGVSPELNIANGGPEWYRHGKDIATVLRQQAQGGGG